MSEIIVTIFNSQKTAHKGSKAILDLHNNGNIALIGQAEIFKDGKGQLMINQAADKASVGTASGFLLGSLAGALVGPAGVLVGAAIGGVIGWLIGMYIARIDSQFLSHVGSLIKPGNSAVVAEVSDGSTTPLDTEMEALGGTVIRRY